MAKIVRTRATPPPAEAAPQTTAPRRVGRPPKAPVPGPALAAKAKSGNGDSTAPPKFTGRTTGLRVQEFQDRLMKDNFKAKLTDAELAEAMRREFPAAIPYTEAHVSGIRTQWNKGKRTSQAGVIPPKSLPEFDAEGNPVAPATRTRTAPAPAAERAPRRRKVAVAEASA